MLASDLSEEAAAAQRYAVSLAGTFGAELRVLYAFRVQPMLFPEEVNMALYQDRFRTEIDRQLGSLVQGIQQEGIRVKAQQRVGQPDDTILDTVREARADVLVLGNHPRRPQQYPLTTGIVEHVVRAAPCPVLTVPSTFVVDAVQTPACIRRLVVVMDWSEPALAACEYATELARPYRAAVTILLLSSLANKAKAAPDVDALARAMRESGLQVDVRTDSGEPSDAIVSHARNYGCDCVVVGMPAHDADPAAGEIVQRVIGQAVCPVITVKSPKFPPGFRPVGHEAGKEGPGSGVGEHNREPEKIAGGTPCTLKTRR
jgi:nucleotide-binding universal stress UspA family protein